MENSERNFIKAAACHTDKCCVGVAFEGDSIFVANTTLPSLAAQFNKAEWRAFVSGVKNGEFDI